MKFTSASMKMERDLHQFTMEQLEFADKAYAMCEKNYENGGDTIVECYTVKELIEQFPSMSLDEVKDFVGLCVEKALNAREGNDDDPQLDEYRRFNEDWDEGQDESQDESQYEGEVIPQEGDYFLSPSGQLGGLISVSLFVGKHLGEFREFGDAIKFIKEHMEQERFWPNIWNVSDHGNLMLLDRKGNAVE